MVYGKQHGTFKNRDRFLDLSNTSGSSPHQTRDVELTNRNSVKALDAAAGSDRSRRMICFDHDDPYEQMSIVTSLFSRALESWWIGDRGIFPISPCFKRAIRLGWKTRNHQTFGGDFLTPLDHRYKKARNHLEAQETLFFINRK